MPRQLGPGGGGGGGGTQLPKHMGPPGPKTGGNPHACDTGSQERKVTPRKSEK